MGNTIAVLLDAVFFRVEVGQLGRETIADIQAIAERTYHIEFPSWTTISERILFASMQA